MLVVVTLSIASVTQTSVLDMLHCTSFSKITTNSLFPAFIEMSSVAEVSGKSPYQTATSIRRCQL